MSWGEALCSNRLTVARPGAVADCWGSTWSSFLSVDGVSWSLTWAAALELWEEQDCPFMWPTGVRRRGWGVSLLQVPVLPAETSAQKPPNSELLWALSQEQREGL